MKAKRLFPTMIMLALSLTSCAGKNVDKVVSINGDLVYANEINFNNACIDVTFSKMDALIKSNEKFVFYLTSSQCSHCEEFKDKLVDYVSKTKTLIYRMDIIDSSKEKYSPDFELFFNEYKEYFFINEAVLTPQVYVVEGKKVAEHISSSRYAQKWMFKRAMNEKVKTGNLYYFESQNAYDSFKSERASKEYYTYYFDRGSELYSKYTSILKGAKKDVALIESSDVGEYGIKAIEHLADGNESTYIFSNNQAENDAFVNKCL